MDSKDACASSIRTPTICTSFSSSESVLSGRIYTLLWVQKEIDLDVYSFVGTPLWQWVILNFIKDNKLIMAIATFKWIILGLNFIKDNKENLISILIFLSCKYTKKINS